MIQVPLQKNWLYVKTFSVKQHTNVQDITDLDAILYSV